MNIRASRLIAVSFNRLAICSVVFAAAACSLLSGGRAAADEPAAKPDAAYEEVRQATHEYHEAIADGDFDTVEKFWAPDADYVDQKGHAFKIRAALKDAKTRLEKEGRIAPAALETQTLAIRMLTPEVAIEDGTIERPELAGRQPSKGRFCAVWVKRDGKWLIDGVRESAYSSVSSSNHFASLEWLIGEWTAEGDKVKVQATYRWGPNKKYITAQVTVNMPGRPPLAITQWIGWDPQSEQVRTFEYDADGGFRQGVWTDEDDSSVVSVSGIGPDGRGVTATRIFTRTGDGKSLWEVTDQQEGGVTMDLQLKATRKPAGK